MQPETPFGSTLTVFQVPDFAVNELVQGKKPVSDVVPEVPVSGEEDEVVSNPLRDMEMIALKASRIVSTVSTGMRWEPGRRRVTQHGI